MPSIHDAMQSMHPQSSTLAAPASITGRRSRISDDEADAEEEESRKRKLFGDLPDAKRRKFILVEDGQRNTRVRVRVTLDRANMDEMPDSHLRTNAVYPRSYFPRQFGEVGGSPPTRAMAEWDDDDDLVDNGPSTKRKTLVRVPLMDGSDTELAVPRMTKSRRSREIALNELGARMSWQQGRTFNGRTLFLQKSRKSTTPPGVGLTVTWG